MELADSSKGRGLLAHANQKKQKYPPPERREEGRKRGFFSRQTMFAAEREDLNQT